MLAGTHVLTGIAIWEFSPGPWWARIPLAAVGGYVSHYLLDSAASYHQCWPDSWGDVAILWVQMACLEVLLGVQPESSHRPLGSGADSDADRDDRGKGDA